MAASSAGKRNRTPRHGTADINSVCHWLLHQAHDCLARKYTPERRRCHITQQEPLSLRYRNSQLKDVDCTAHITGGRYAHGRVIYPKKLAVSQKTCHAAKRV